MFVDVHYVSNPEGRTDGILTGAGRQADLVKVVAGFATPLIG